MVTITLKLISCRWCISVGGVQFSKPHPSAVVTPNISRSNNSKPHDNSSKIMRLMLVCCCFFLYGHSLIKESGQQTIADKNNLNSYRRVNKVSVWRLTALILLWLLLLLVKILLLLPLLLRVVLMQGANLHTCIVIGMQLESRPHMNVDAQM